MSELEKQLKRVTELYCKYLQNCPTFITPRLRSNLKISLSVCTHILRQKEFPHKEKEISLLIKRRNEIMCHLNFKDVAAIRLAVKKGKIICVEQDHYIVKYCDKLDDFFILNTQTDNSVTLTQHNSDVLIDKISNFYEKKD